MIEASDTRDNSVSRLEHAYSIATNTSEGALGKYDVPRPTRNASQIHLQLSNYGIITGLITAHSANRRHRQHWDYAKECDNNGVSFNDDIGCKCCASLDQWIRLISLSIHFPRQSKFLLLRANFRFLHDTPPGRYVEPIDTGFLYNVTRVSISSLNDSVLISP